MRWGQHFVAVVLGRWFRSDVRIKRPTVGGSSLNVSGKVGGQRLV